MLRRQYGVCEILFSRDVRQSSVFLRSVLAATVSRQQIVHASQGRNTHLGLRQTNYYDVLKVTPKATQAQVKDAYYKLSKMYHPDQYRGEEDPAKKFREVKEAYEVLGNFHQRKMYDKGLLGISSAAAPAEAEEYASKFYESRSKRRTVPTASGRTPIYNFDEWSRAHYQASRVRREDAKMRYSQMLKERTFNEEEKRTQSVVTFLTLSLLMFVLHCAFSRGHDVQKTKSK